MYERGVIWHRRGIDSDYERELLSFPRGMKDDRADAMAMQIEAMKSSKKRRRASRYIPGYVSYGRIKDDHPGVVGKWLSSKNVDGVL